MAPKLVEETIKLENHCEEANTKAKAGKNAAKM